MSEKIIGITIPGTTAKIGKTEVVRQLCQESNVKLIEVRLTLMDPADMQGLPLAEGNSLQPSFLPTEGRGVILLDELLQASPAVQVAGLKLWLRQSGLPIPAGWSIIAGFRNEEEEETLRSLAIINGNMRSVANRAAPPKP